MGRRSWFLAFSVLNLTALTLGCASLSPPTSVWGLNQPETSSPPGRTWATPDPPLFSAAGFSQAPAGAGEKKSPSDAEKEKGNGNGNGKDNGDKAKEPEHIRDNAFLVEEAFNQEAGEVQHIFNWINLWDRSSLGRTRDLAWSYTMELPLGSQKHQFSFTVQTLGAFEKPKGESPTQPGGLGDTFLNYRYQLLADDDFLWCAPRLSLIAPTGDERFGLGTGRVGYQFNLPVSRYGDRFDFHFNAGFTYTPNVSAFLTPETIPGGNLPMPDPSLQGIGNGALLATRSPRRDLRGYNLGASAYWKPRVNLNFFVEGLALWNDEIDDRGSRRNITQVFVNPGVRYAVCQFEEVEWVIGVSAPIGLTRNTPDIGIFVYMSVEHAFRKVRKNGGE